MPNSALYVQRGYCLWGDKLRGFGYNSATLSQAFWTAAWLEIYFHIHNLA
jgi:hypothetical protein